MYKCQHYSGFFSVIIPFPSVQMTKSRTRKNLAQKAATTCANRTKLSKTQDRLSQTSFSDVTLSKSL